MSPEQAQAKLGEIRTSALYIEMVQDEERKRAIEAELNAIQNRDHELCRQRRAMKEQEAEFVHVASGKCVDFRIERFWRGREYCKNTAKFTCEKCGAITCGVHVKGHRCAL